MNRDLSTFRYFRFHALDVAKAPLLVFTLVAAGLSVVLWRFTLKDPSSAPAPDTFLTATLSVVLTVACLMAAGGVAGNDVARGYYRSWFSKPMAPWWFYLQRWLLGGVAVLCIPVLLGVGMALVFGKGTGLTGAVFAKTALIYLLVGGTVLLVSVFTARDWLVAFFLTFLQGRLEDVTQLMKITERELPWAVDWLHRILPPYQMVGMGQGVPEGHKLTHVILYGLAMVVVALILFEKKPLGSGGRA